MLISARILCAISADRPTAIKSLLESLAESRPPWTLIRDHLLTLEAQELIIIQHRNGMITAVQLTELGSERAQEALESAL